MPFLAHMFDRLRYPPLRFAPSDDSLDYVMACFSQAAYVPTPYDIADGRNTKVIPSDLLQASVRAGGTASVARVLGAVFGAEGEIAVRQVVTANSVTTLVRIAQVVVIALRGTVLFHTFVLPTRDLGIDLKAWRAPRSIRLNENHRYHLGFLAEAEQILPLVRAEYDAIGRGLSIHLTGHSLGGALAAVLDRLWDVDRAGDDRATRVFGCPRFGNHDAVAARPLRAIARRRDPVVRMPPHWLGYADATSAVVGDGRRNRSFNPFAAHTIEGYRTALAYRDGIADVDDDFYARFIAALQTT